MCKQEKMDELLVKEFIAGNHNSFNILLNRYKDKLFSYILYMVKNHEVTQDIFQDTFYKAINKIKSGNYREEGKFIQWLMRIAHNLVIDYFRREKKYSTINSADDTDVFDYINISQPSIEDILINRQIFYNVRHLINNLPPEQKEVVILRYYMNMSFKEIAKKTNVSINTQLGRMRYAILNMRKMLKHKEDILMK